MTINNPMHATYTTRYATRKAPKIQYMSTSDAIRHYCKYRVLPFLKYSAIALTIYAMLVFYTIYFTV